MSKSRGFVTVATGKYYCWLAENLYMSYKLFGNCDYPFYVITDKVGEKRLKKTFDGVIVMENPQYGFLDKLAVYRHSPFEETIFFDADMNVINDISYLFDEFDQNGSALSLVGTLKEITDTQRPNHFTNIAIEKYGFTHYFSFGGGIYYFKRSQRVTECMDHIINVLVPNYEECGLAYLPKTKSTMMDEACYEVGMLLYDFYPLTSQREIMRFHTGMMKSFRWNQKERKCTFDWWEGKQACPDIAHYATFNTYTKKYVYYNALVCSQYKGIPKVVTYISMPFRMIALGFRRCKEPGYRRDMINWVKGHFTLAYWRGLPKRIGGKLFKK